VVAGVEEDHLDAGDRGAREVGEQPVGHGGGDREVLAEGLARPGQDGEGLLDRVGDAPEARVGLGGQLRRRADCGGHSLTPVPISRTVKARRQAAHRQPSAVSP